MNDTSPEIEAFIREKLMALPGETRLQMGARMFDAAREMVLASIPAHLPEVERMRQLTERVYGPEIAAMWLEGWRKRGVS